MQSDEPLTTYTAFSGDRLIASGDASPVALVVKAALAEGAARVLVFEDATGREVDFNLQGTDDDIRARLAAVPEVEEPSRAGRGRPKLGVVSREVTLLPRHWNWLATQPGGASAALRRLVDEARKSRLDVDALRLAQDAAYRAMSALAGDLPGFEEASRALYARDAERFRALITSWPIDVRDYVLRLAAPVDAPRA